MTNSNDDTGGSREACPVCGAHELHLLYFPSVDLTGARPLDDTLGLGDIRPDMPPGIGCTACGSEWENLDLFNEAKTDN